MTKKDGYPADNTVNCDLSHTSSEPISISQKLREEAERIQNLIDAYLSKGDPSIEILTPNQFEKYEELINAAEIAEKYGL